MRAPPLLAGRANATVTLSTPAVTDVILGALGTVAGPAPATVGTNMTAHAATAPIVVLEPTRTGPPCPSARHNCRPQRLLHVTVPAPKKKRPRSEGLFAPQIPVQIGPNPPNEVQHALVTAGDPVDHVVREQQLHIRRFDPLRAIVLVADRDVSGKDEHAPRRHR